MIVRLRLKRAPQQPPPIPATPLVPARGSEVVTWQEMAGGLASLLSPAAAICFSLAFWRLGQDIGFARSFFIVEGPFSHWQVWFVCASLVLGAGQWLNRRARVSDDEPATN